MLYTTAHVKPCAAGAQTTIREADRCLPRGSFVKQTSQGTVNTSRPSLGSRGDKDT